MAAREIYDVLIVGAGPAGMAAARAAWDAGRRVAVLDDNPLWGGQIARDWPRHLPPGALMECIERFTNSGCVRRPGTSVVAAPEPGVLLAERAGGDPVEFAYDRLVLATGARERFLPFPGWTSPRVTGAGGLQAIVKDGMPIAGKRVVVAGSGPLLLAVAAGLRKRGARVLLVAEQAPWGRVMRFGTSLLTDRAKLTQAVALKARLIGVPYLTSCWPTSATDTPAGLRVSLQTRRGSREVDCDHLACGFFLLPNPELAGLLGCRIEAGAVAVDARQATTVPGVYAAGEATGIGGLDKSLIEGQIAGLAAAGDLTAADRLSPRRDRARRFAAKLRHAFALRDELKAVARDDTLVCRCEDVPLGRLRPYPSLREARLQTRCGMGPCQGRVCGAACEFLLGWNDASPRPPVLPAAVGTLMH
jgi:NADPH-dependent 2,4-dienoyl-CoA reductase/sulfur reductase-like enzyme